MMFSIRGIDMEVADERLKPLVEMIHKYRRGYEQEGYIKEQDNI